MLQNRCFSTMPVTPRVNKLFINGEFVKPVKGNTFTTINPHNEEIITDVYEAGREDVDRAVEVARHTFEKGPWRRASGSERANVMFKFADLLEKNRRELSLLEALDNGKPYWVADFIDINFAIDLYRYCAGWADKIHGDTIPMTGDYFGYVKKEPVGVCAQIIPWNFPILMMALKLAPTLATG